MCSLPNLYYWICWRFFYSCRLFCSSHTYRVAPSRQDYLLAPSKFGMPSSEHCTECRTLASLTKQPAAESPDISWPGWRATCGTASSKLWSAARSSPCTLFKLVSPRAVSWAQHFSCCTWTAVRMSCRMAYSWLSTLTTSRYTRCSGRKPRSSKAVHYSKPQSRRSLRGVLHERYASSRPNHKPSSSTITGRHGLCLQSALVAHPSMKRARSNSSASPSTPIWHSTATSDQLPSVLTAVYTSCIARLQYSAPDTERPCTRDSFARSWSTLPSSGWAHRRPHLPN